VRHHALVCVLVVWSIVMAASGIINVGMIFLAKESFSAGDFGFGRSGRGPGSAL
jgi:hypothetical protein